MEIIKLLFVFVELIVVIESTNLSTKCETPVLENSWARLRQRGRLIRYQCLSTFTLVGNRYSVCTEGQWDDPIPMCIKPGCAPKDVTENSFTDEDINGAVIAIFCRPGYFVVGNRETYCNGTAWDRSLGTCRENHAGPAVACDFEITSICGWEAHSTHDFDFMRINGDKLVRQLQSGPSQDHTIGKPLEGHFMFASFVNQPPNSTARLISPTYQADASKDACFRLYYRMNGLGGILRVYIKPESLTIADVIHSPEYLVSEKRGSDENVWMESVNDINEYDQHFQIVIEATTVSRTRSSITIDDVAILSGADCRNENFKSTVIIPEEDGIDVTPTEEGA